MILNLGIVSATEIFAPSYSRQFSRSSMTGTFSDEIFRAHLANLVKNKALHKFAQSSSHRPAQGAELFATSSSPVVLGHIVTDGNWDHLGAPGSDEWCYRFATYVKSNPKAIVEFHQFLFAPICPVFAPSNFIKFSLCQNLGSRRHGEISAKRFFTSFWIWQRSSSGQRNSRAGHTKIFADQMSSRFLREFLCDDQS